MQTRQAGHYNHYTNIGAGLHKSRIELEQQRTGRRVQDDRADDRRNRQPAGEHDHGRSTTSLTEANACKASKIPVVTISMGAGADVALMQQVADLTGGQHFNIPGGQTAAQYEEDLKEIFEEVAKTRPLKLVQ